MATLDVTPLDKALRQLKAGLKEAATSPTSEIIRDGLRIIEEREQRREAKLEWLRAEIQKGRDSGPPREFDPKTLAEEVKARGRRRLAAAKLAAEKNG